MHLLRGSVLTLLYRVGGTGFALLTSIVAARALNVSDLGTYVTITVSVQAIGSVAASVGSATGFFVSRGERPAAEVAANGLVLSCILGLVLFVVPLGALPFIDGNRQVIVVLAALALFPIIARNALGGVFLGSDALARYNFSVQGPAVLTFVALGALVLLGHRTVEAALAAWLTGQYLSFFVLLFMSRGWWTWLWQHRPDWPLMRSMLSFGAVIGLAGVISYFNYRVDQLLVAGFDGTEGAGIYSRAVTIAEALWLVSTSIAVASYASVGGMSRHDAAALTSTCVRHTLLFVSGGALVVFLAAPWVLALLFGERYDAAATSLRVLCVGTALFAPQSILANYFTVQLGRPGLSMFVAATSCLINVGVSLLLIPRFGYVGGAWATTISYFAVAGLSVGLFLRHSDAKLADLWRIRAADIASYVRLARRVLTRPAPGAPVSKGT